MELQENTTDQYHNGSVGFKQCSDDTSIIGL